jgi:GNAT superfamily N-acetyltransferase
MRRIATAQFSSNWSITRGTVDVRESGFWTYPVSGLASPCPLVVNAEGGSGDTMKHLERTGNATVLVNGFTGVLPVCRNRGIARTLKLQAIDYARSHGYRQILTSNHADNGPLLRVNEILGFQESSRKIRFEKTLTTWQVANERSLRFNRSERDECARPS